MVRLLNGTLMRIFTLWQTVECDPHYLCAGALSAPVLLSLWGWSGPCSVPCIAIAVVHAVRRISHHRHMRCIACRDRQTPRQ